MEFLTFTIGDLASILAVVIAGFQIYHKMGLEIHELKIHVTDLRAWRERHDHDG